MNKKTLLKVFIFVLLIIVSLLILFFVNPITKNSIDLSFSVLSDNTEPQSLQVFYIDKDNDTVKDYSEDQKIDILLSDKSNENVKVSLPDTITSFRIDFDSKVKDCELKEMVLLYSNKIIPVDINLLKQCDLLNDIDITNVDDNNFKFKISGEDPYISWNVTDWKISEYTREKTHIRNVVAKIIIILLIWISFFIFIKHFETLIEFPVEIVYNRGLIMQLSLNDFKTRFAGSYLGIVWAFVQPIVTILLYWFVFEKAFHATGVGNVPFALWLTTGLVPWFFFSEALMGATSSLLEYQYLVKKMVFQIDILPVVKIISAIYVHVFFILLTFVIFIFSGMHISIYWIQTIYYSLCVVVFTLGLSYITSAITAFFKDLTQIINVLLTVGTWLTPIMWNFNSAGLSGLLYVLLMANPMFYIVQGYRDSMVDHIWFWQRPSLTLYFWMVTTTIFCTGTVIYRRLKVHFADVL